jgi:alpha-tubulin suppressor-like RCC1 family protein
MTNGNWRRARGWLVVSGLVQFSCGGKNVPASETSGTTSTGGTATSSAAGVAVAGQAGVSTTSGPCGSPNAVTVRAVAVGTRHTCALMTTSGVRCWGSNEYGQLGDGTLTSRRTPPTIDVLSGVQAIAAGDYHTCALMTTGGVRCWGINSAGELGEGTTQIERSLTPIAPTGFCQ